MHSIIRFRQASLGYKCLPTRTPYQHAFSTSTRAAAALSPTSPLWRVKPKAKKPVRLLNPPAGASLKSGPASSQQAKKAYTIFKKLVLARLNLVLERHSPEDYQAFGIKSKLDLEREAKLFHVAVEKACDAASENNAFGKDENPLTWSLRNAFVEGDLQGLTTQIQYAFYDHLTRSRFPASITATHKKLADFRFPHEWFPATRALQRTIHLHVGPTNSGKTYNALKALENAKSGIYAGPLRLLAHEVYSRFVAKGKKCALVTGEEQRIPEDEDNYFRSCTVEMTPLNTVVDVAVIDEIQMMGDGDRGWAWTQAFLGVQAKEVHLCGEERTVDLIKSLCETIGDKLEIHRYQRLSPLQTMKRSLGGGFQKLEKGDAVVCFSRLDIHAIKNEIEEKTGKRVAIVYGGLPPETRAQQAALFNDHNNDYDFLVASDAIGMGLNLEIRRVVFVQVHKRDQFGFRQITTSEIKQIGGRAGRFKSAAQAIEPGRTTPSQETNSLGLVTALEDADLDIIEEAFKKDAPPLTTAGIQPPPAVIERFTSYFPPNTPFSYILSSLRHMAQVSPRYHLCHLKEMLQICDYIQPYQMSVYDRCVFLNAPVFLREQNGPQILQAFARCVSNMEGGYLLDIPEINLELLDTEKADHPRGPGDYLRQLETLHKSITLYLWLSYRYSGVFLSQNLAFHVKELVETKIDLYLSEVNLSERARKARAVAARKAAKQAVRKKERVLGGEGQEDGDRHMVPGEWNEEGHEEPLFDDPKKLEAVNGPA